MNLDYYWNYLSDKSWSDKKTARRVVEELSELSFAVLKLVKTNKQSAEYEKRLKNLKEEIIDVNIVLRHLEAKYGSCEIELYGKLEKLRKIKIKLEGEKEK